MLANIYHTSAGGFLCIISFNPHISILQLRKKAQKSSIASEDRKGRSWDLFERRLSHSTMI